MNLNILWFILVAVLILGWSVMDGFDYGVGGLLRFISKNDNERRYVMNAIGPVWEGNQVWLILGGGAVFAAFPKVYASVFSGFYLAFMLVVWLIIFRAVSFEFRSRVESKGWRNFWDTDITVTGLGISLLLGVAIANILMGVPLNKDHIDYQSLFSLLNIFGLAGGLLSLSMFLMHGSTYLIMKTEGEVQKRARDFASGFAIAYIIFTILFLSLSLVFAQRLLDNSFGIIGDIVPVIMIIGAIGVIVSAKSSSDIKPFAYSVLGIVGAVASLAVGVFPDIVPSSINPEYSLNIYNSASNHLTLFVMLIATIIGLPLVLIYAFYAYKKFGFKVKMDESSY
ncbi:MAG: cytochrome d ubiquinol oxidase subunit II [Deltaproteobacteria bacterium]|jgi:cytochrome d ubiquinol oxidase subunit II|nr:cytochrome d ubiquinol oxidase subunit II [Deltaproteobacteria bacterium]MCL5879945.1 cytochrome d ubiquinol oxidase subunit II [Deltaproteobacteria bacterium]MDA8304346.1 cytochrome d ubiquinol oxidase subunit II [Deltaproteobacteria bacterium]